MTMQYTRLGNSGLIVSRLALGTMTFNLGSEFIPGVASVGQEAANEMVATALDAGINFFDSADGYSSGEAEIALGKALADKRKKAIICTKIGFRQSDLITDAGLSRNAILNGVEGCLKRLNTDYIDVLVVHKTDFTTPLEETLKVLDEVVASGKVRYIGFSNWPAWQAARAIEIQRANGWAQFITGQYLYNAAGRDLEHDAIPMMDEMGVSLMAWSPLSGGLLSGKYDPQNIGKEGRLASGDFLEVDPIKAAVLLRSLGEIAKNLKTEIASVALSWILHKRRNATILVGASKTSHLNSALAACDIHLDQEEVDQIDSAFVKARVYPNWFDEMMTDPVHTEILN